MNQSAFWRQVGECLAACPPCVAAAGDMPGLARRVLWRRCRDTVGVIDVPELFCHKIDGGGDSL